MLGSGMIIGGFALVITLANRARREHKGDGVGLAALIVLGLEGVAILAGALYPIAP